MAGPKSGPLHMIWLGTEARCVGYTTASVLTRKITSVHLFLLNIHCFGQLGLDSNLGRAGYD